MKAAFLATLFLLASGARVCSQTVATTYGAIQGNLLPGSVHEFLGIPFAKPPVDSLRWKAPQPPAAWAGVRQTTQFAPECPQKRFEQGNDSSFVLEGEEDCLYLNVWTPQLGAADLPVLVFIHGGGNQQGSARQMTGGTLIYSGRNVAQRGPAVVVTLQYRLGPLGYLVHPGLEEEHPDRVSGNYGMLDQILALKWVRDNIAKFGGNPSKVMVFGESAGGVNTGNLLVSPLARGLFQRACIQSASPVLGPYQEAKNKGIAFVNGFSPTGTPRQQMAYMRNLPADSLTATLSSPLEGGLVQMNWQPVQDGSVFPAFPLDAFQSGAYNQVPLMIGSNADEMSLSAPPVVTPAMVTLLINRLPPIWRAGATALYPPGSSNEQARNAYVALLTDAQFTAPARRTAQCVSVNQTQPVWRYFFTHRHTVQALAGLGAYHGMELFYVFNTWENATLGSGFLFRPQDDSVQTNMLRYWVNFAHTGDPNGPGLTLWPRYQRATDCYLEIKATPDGRLCGLRTQASNFWDQVSGFSGCSGAVSVRDADNMDPADIQLFPNPTDGLVHIRFQKMPSAYQVSLQNAMGQTLIPPQQQSVLDLRHLPKGIYYLSVRVDDRQLTRKIVKTTK